MPLVWCCRCALATCGVACTVRVAPVGLPASVAALVCRACVLTPLPGARVMLASTARGVVARLHPQVMDPALWDHPQRARVVTAQHHAATQLIADYDGVADEAVSVCELYGTLSPWVCAIGHACDDSATVCVCAWPRDLHSSPDSRPTMSCCAARITHDTCQQHQIWRSRRVTQT